MIFKFQKISLILIIVAVFINCQSTQAATRDIFKKPTANKTAPTIKKAPASTTSQLEEAARLKELMDILNQNATVTYPLIDEIGQLKQVESQPVVSPAKSLTPFNKALPYSLGLIVLLILVIIIFLWRWLNQKSKLFFDQRNEALTIKPMPALPIKPIEQAKPQNKIINQEVVKKTVVSQPIVNQLKPKNNQPGVLNLKNLDSQVKTRAKKNKFI